MVNKYYETYNFNNMFKLTYMLYMIRSMILLFIYVNNNEFAFSGLGLKVIPGSSEHDEAKRM